MVLTWTQGIVDSCNQGWRSDGPEAASLIEPKESLTKTPRLPFAQRFASKNYPNMPNNLALAPKADRYRGASAETN